MAIIIRGKTKCPLCGQVIKTGDDIVATSHFIADHNDPLWPFSDAAMHKTCFLDWDQRMEFVARFNNIVENIVFPNGTRRFMEDNGTVIAKDSL